MSLAFSLDQLLRSSTVDPPLQGAQFIEHSLIRGLQRFVRCRCLVQHTAQFGRLSKRRQQELLALGEIRAEERGRHP